MWIATAAEMREIERRAETEYGISPETLMENAGAAALAVAAQMVPSNGQIIVLCGKGNNGGDGLVFARLASISGFNVTVLVAAGEADLSPLAAKNLQRINRRRVNTIFFDSPDWSTYFPKIHIADLVVDALLGTGLRGDVTGPTSRVLQDLRQYDPQVLALDVPSGVETDTGHGSIYCVRATRTVTFGLPKPFLFQGPGIEHSGQWTVDHIGLPEQILDHTRALLIEGPIPFYRPRDAHKGDNGHILIVAGSSQYRGAATLATLGALGAGAGLVTVAAIEPVVAAVAALAPEATFISLPEVDGAIDGSLAAERIQECASQFTAAVFGPGLTTAPRVRSFLEHLWPTWSVPSVIDADALNLVSFGLALPSCPKVLTPHPGEAGRLLGCDVPTVQSDRFGAARKLQTRFGCAVLLKGAYTVVAEDDFPLIVNSSGNPGMATGGMGDVLSGVIATLLSETSVGPAGAGVTGAYWHGLAGDLAAKEIGEIGYSASDLAQFLPRARSILTT